MKVLVINRDYPPYALGGMGRLTLYLENKNFPPDGWIKVR